MLIELSNMLLCAGVLLLDCIQAEIVSVSYAKSIINSKVSMLPDYPPDNVLI